MFEELEILHTNTLKFVNLYFKKNCKAFRIKMVWQNLIRTPRGGKGKVNRYSRVPNYSIIDNLAQ